MKKVVLLMLFCSLSFRASPHLLQAMDRQALSFTLSKALMQAMDKPSYDLWFYKQKPSDLFSAIFPMAWAKNTLKKEAALSTPKRVTSSSKAGGAKSPPQKLTPQAKKASLKKERVDSTKKPNSKAKKSSNTTTRSGLVVEKILAQIGEDILSLIDFKNFQKQLSLGLIPSSLLLQNVFKKSQLMKDPDLLLEFMIARHILYQTAKKEENLPKLSSKQVDKALTQLKGKMSHKKFATRIKASGLTLKTLRDLIAVDLTNDILLSFLVLPKVMVSEKEIEARHFKQYQRTLFENFEYDFVSVQFSEDKKSRVLKALKEQTPLPLEKMAHRLGLETKHSKLKDQDINKIFKTELEKLSVSQNSSVIFLNGNYYILKLKWKTPIISPKEKAIRDRLEKQIHKQKLKTELIQWVKEKKAGFFIKQHSI